MGFRGEALPSIASVSRFTLTTRERDSATFAPKGTQIIVNGGKIAEVKAAGSAPGTSVEVRQLFFNLPARRKFLRTEETEAAHIQHYLTLAALAFPEVAFTSSRTGATSGNCPPSKIRRRPLPAASKPCANASARCSATKNCLPVNFSAALDDDGNHPRRMKRTFLKPPRRKNPKSETRNQKSASGG